MLELVIIVLVVANIFMLWKKKFSVDITAQLRDVEEAVKNELQRNRTEANDNAEKNRQELKLSMDSLEQKLSDNASKANAVLGQQFGQQQEQQQKFNQQTNEAMQASRLEMAQTMASFEKKLSANLEQLNRLLDEKLSQQASQQLHFYKQSSDEAKENRLELTKALSSFEKVFKDNIMLLNTQLQQRFDLFNQHQEQTNKQTTSNIKSVEQAIEKELKSIREDNSKQLAEMRHTVDEKLQTTLEKRLGESFKQVSDRLEQVHKGLGDMQNVAAGVGDLKRVLSNVKTRGTLGEYQLEGILEQMLSVNQYAKNVATKKGSQANVEFAIKLPGEEVGKEVWIPIDSKFPMEDYNRLLDAFELGDKAAIDTFQNKLLKTIEKFAQDISSKYIDPPHTTDFAVMFLPVEGIYAEVLRHPKLFEKLQYKYKVTVTGPTTLSAFLSSLQMGFRTLAVQKRSSEVWGILKAVKSEFETFTGVFDKVKKQLDTASGTLETLRSTRTNAISRKLRDVETLPLAEAEQVLALPSVSQHKEDT